MRRELMTRALETQKDPWDVIIIGGGATGLGCAVDASSRGYRTLLLEQHDFAKGTSSRSTKLVHGGVRYLRQGNVSLVLEALKERGLLLRNAPHLVRNLPFVVPNYSWWEGPFYGIGLKMYDVLAGRSGFGRSRHLSKAETIERIPTIEPEGLDGGVIYFDGQFDDARLAINLAQTAAEQGGILLNYVKVTGLLKEEGEIRGVRAVDQESGASYQLSAKVVVNATGVFSDTVRQMDDPEAVRMISPSQGVHIVLDRSFLPGDSAIMVPKTDDGRVLFAIPWHDRVVVGTTDTPVATISLEPHPLAEEVSFLLEHTARYLTQDPKPEDVLSVFAGLRPLVSHDSHEGTASLSRDHTLDISDSGLVTIAGGKWTTYRRMAEDTIDQAATLAGLEDRESVTKGLHIHGYHTRADEFATLSDYGADAPLIQSLMQEDRRYGERLHPDYDVRVAQVVWAVRHEAARTVEDFLSRRSRMLLIDARASMVMAPQVARWMAEELGRDAGWQESQIEAYAVLASGYLWSESGFTAASA
ncbi:MAG: glycerol-3-phosphate dehydrogenase/oxidase [Gemmatimonadota bacterium]